MTTVNLIRVQLLFGYLAWGTVLVTYVVPWLSSLPRANAVRAIAALHSFRFFGLVFILPGFVGAGVPSSFAVSAAYGDFATSILALATLATFRMRAVFWTCAVAFNVVGAADLILDTVHAFQSNIPLWGGQLGAAYAIPILYVPLLMLTHVVALWLAVRRTGERAVPSRALRAAST